MSESVNIAFDCLPLRNVGRLDIPLDASPNFRARCERIKDALETHGSHNAYYLVNATCTFQLTNDRRKGMLRFAWEGTVLTDPDDQVTVRCDLNVTLAEETCDWLTEPVVQWFSQTVTEAVVVEFDRYIASGDLAEAKRRASSIEAISDQAGGFLGMNL